MCSEEDIIFFLIGYPRLIGRPKVGVGLSTYLPSAPAIGHTSQLPPASVRHVGEGDIANDARCGMCDISPARPPAHIHATRATCVATVFHGNRHTLTRDLIVGYMGTGGGHGLTRPSRHSPISKDFGNHGNQIRDGRSRFRTWDLPNARPVCYHWTKSLGDVDNMWTTV